MPDPDMSSSPDLKAQKKRKRNDVPEEQELEIDVNLPEPPSKKAKRKEKKAKLKPVKPAATVEDSTKADNAEAEADGEHIHPARKGQVSATKKEEKRSDYGIWIGNLSFKTTKDSLRRFFVDRGGLDESTITRLHMPVDNNTKQNKGFAYVDFTSEATLAIAMSCTEKLVDGRKVLIKNAKSFEGRPLKTKTEEEAAKGGNLGGKPPSKRIFVGNLGFDMTREELADHFSQAGQVEDVFLATFEDSGKCKGFGWVTFADIEASTKAVRGYIFKEQAEEEDGDDGEVVQNDDDSSEGDDRKQKKKRKPKKPMKWFINRVQGRVLRCEFAEDKQTRYNKRYGKGAPGKLQIDGGDDHNEELSGDENINDLAAAAAAARKKRDPAMKKMNKDERQEARRRKHDARMTAPGKALASAQRSDKEKGAIIAGAGKKVKFE